MYSEDMKIGDIDSSTYAKIGMLKGCLTSKDILWGQSICDEMKKKGLENDVH